MKVLIIKSLDHYLCGWSYLSNHLKNTIKELFPNSTVEIINIPYTSIHTSSYYFYTYKNIDIKDKYDLIFVCEGRPSKKWSKNGKIIWIPMQEFLSGGPWKFIKNSVDPWYSVLSPSKYLYDKIKKINPNIEIDYIQLWSKPIIKEKNKNDNIKIFFHFKTRNWGEQFWIKLIRRLSNNFPNFKYIIKADNHSNLNISNINLNNVSQIFLGNIEDREQYIDALSGSDVYLTPRIMEGIGLCSQEAAQLGNVLVGLNYTTHNEYFSSSNGLMIEKKEYSTNQSQIILDEQKTITIAEKQIPRIIDFLKELDNDKEELYRIQNFNKEYSLLKYREFKENFNQYILKNTKSQKIRKTNVLHIQFCLEGGQGLASTLIASGLQKYTNINNIFYYLSDKENDKAVKSYLQKLEDSDVKYNKIENTYEIEEKYDVVFVNWSSSAERRNIDFSQWYEWIKNNKSITIGFIHDSVKIMPDICNYYCVASNFNMKFSPNRENTFIIPCPIENCFFEIQDKDKLNYKNNPFVIGRISRLIDRKFHNSFPFIAKYINKKYPYTYFDIIGEGEYEDKLRKDFSDIQFEIRKGAYDKERAKIMSNSDICLYLTSEHEESFGMGVAEYLALGIPVICENKGALKEIVGDGGVACDSLHDVLNYIEKLIEDKDFRKQMGKKAKNKATEYTEEKVSNQYSKMINKILKNPEWSIIMPAYNVENYIKTAIQSIINQKHKDWELIIINDSSTDRTQEIINSYKNIKIKNILLEDGPHSQAYCWQKGLEIAKGKYLGFVDSDDYLLDNAILEMDNYYNSCLSVICAWSQNEKWDSDLKNKIYNGLSEDPYKYGDLIDGMLKEPGLMISHFITCKKQSLLEIGGFDTLIPTSADRWLALNMDLKGKLGFNDKILYKYRFLRPGCITLEKRKTQIQTTEKILNQALEKRNDSRRVKAIINKDNFGYKLELI